MLTNQYCTLHINVEDKVKVTQQLFIEHTLRDRLREIKRQKGIPISKTVTEILEKNLRKYEEGLGIQAKLDKSTTKSNGEQE